MSQERVSSLRPAPMPCLSVPRATVRSMLSSLLEVLFPAGCAGCGRPGRPFCGACRPAVAVLSPPGCRRCGRPLEVAVERCPDCPGPPIEWVRSAALYAGPVREALMRLKFGGQRSVAASLAVLMAAALERAPPPQDSAAGRSPPVLTWVPLARRRRRSRGYDQAEALARAVARLHGRPVRRLLVRTVETAPQARRSASERRVGLHDAFRLVGSDPVPPAVVLVDDVLTTGETARACAAALVVGGVRSVGVLAAARSIRGPVPARCYTPGELLPGSVVARETCSR